MEGKKSIYDVKEIVGYFGKKAAMSRDGNNDRMKCNFNYYMVRNSHTGKIAICSDYYKLEQVEQKLNLVNIAFKLYLEKKVDYMPIFEVICHGDNEITTLAEFKVGDKFTDVFKKGVEIAKQYGDNIKKYDAFEMPVDQLVIKTWGTTKYDCPCGGRYTNYGKKNHLKTKIHSNYLKTGKVKGFKKERVKCECGGIYTTTNGGKYQHERTELHTRYFKLPSKKKDAKHDEVLTVDEPECFIDDGDCVWRLSDGTCGCC